MGTVLFICLMQQKEYSSKISPDVLFIALKSLSNKIQIEYNLLLIFQTLVGSCFPYKTCSFIFAFCISILFFHRQVVWLSPECGSQMTNALPNNPRSGFSFCPGVRQPAQRVEKAGVRNRAPHFTTLALLLIPCHSGQFA